MASPEFNGIERRTRTRYPLMLELRYDTPAKRGQVSGAGWTINVSSQGVLIQVSEPHHVAAGAQLEVSMEWPVLLDGTIPLQLKVDGIVTRVEKSSFALSFHTKAFRTRNKSSKASPEPVRHSGVA